MRRDIADGIPDAPIGRSVRSRTVHPQHVVQRHLAQLQRDIYAFARRHRRPQSQKTVVGKSIAMLELVLEVGEG
jgi:hypothetical protein